MIYPRIRTETFLLYSSSILTLSQGQDKSKMRLTAPSTVAALIAASPQLVNKASVGAFMLKVNGAANGIKEGQRSFLGAAADRAIEAGKGAPKESFLVRAKEDAEALTDDQLAGAAEMAAMEMEKMVSFMEMEKKRMAAMEMIKKVEQKLKLERTPSFIESEFVTKVEYNAAVEEHDIQIIRDHPAHVSREEAIAVLKKNNNDLVEVIMSITS